MLKFQLRKTLCQKETGIAFLIMLAVCLASYILNCVEFYGEYTSNLIASNQLAIINDYGRLAFVFRLLLPAAAALPCSGIYYHEKKNNILPVALSRSGSQKKYYFSSLFASFAVSFAVVLLPLIINVLLNNLTFVGKSVRNVGNHPSSDDPYYSLASKKFILLDALRIKHPQVYNVVFAVSISLFSGVIGVFTYNISFLFKKNNYLSFAVFFIVSNIIDVISSAASEHGVNIAYLDYLFANKEIPGKNVPAFCCMLLILAVFIAATAFPAIKKLKKVL